jgi:hypothetical protein
MNSEQNRFAESTGRELNVDKMRPRVDIATDLEAIVGAVAEDR